MESSWYCTREDVKAALDAAETARNNRQVDRACRGAIASINSLCHRSFVPTVATRKFDGSSVAGQVLRLDRHNLVSATSITVDGTALTTSDYLLCPQSGPPYTSIAIDDDSAAAWSSERQANVIVGVWMGDDLVTEPAGALAEALDDTETAVDVTDSASIGVGDLIGVDSERMIVTGKSMLDTGVNIDAADSLTASVADVSITMSTTTGAPVVDETILIDSERMLVVDVAGSVLTVKRAWDGSVLATHAGAADIHAPRTLTVVRGALGTTAATHLVSAAITRHVVPPLVRNLAVAEAMNTLLSEGSGYARIAGSGNNAREWTGRGLQGLRDQVYAAYGRKARIRSV